MKRLICDLDGCLFDNTWREHLIPEDKSRTEGWVEFNKACKDDPVISDTLDIVDCLMMHANFDQLIFVTGRGIQAEEECKEALEGTFLDYSVLIMRPENDHRKAVHFKRDVFSQLHIQPNDVLVEDDPAIIKMVQEEFPCYLISVPSKCSAVIRGDSQNGSEQK